MLFPLLDQASLNRIVQNVGSDSLHVAVRLALDVVIAIAQPQVADDAMCPGAVCRVALETKEELDQVCRSAGWPRPGRAGGWA